MPCIESVLPQCAAPGAVDAYVAALTLAVESESRRRNLVCVGRDSFLPGDLGKPGARLTDSHWAILEGLPLVAHPNIVGTLTEAAGTLLCFESFHMESGIAMRLHRESWYVRPRDPGFYSAWIALEDGAELQYLPGSADLGGLDEGSEADIAQLAAMPGVRTFTASKGGVLIAPGNLAIGGGPSGKWLCAHYCALANDPPYFPHLLAAYRTKYQWTRNLYLSTAYPGLLLRPHVTPQSEASE